MTDTPVENQSASLVEEAERHLGEITPGPWWMPDGCENVHAHDVPPPHEDAPNDEWEAWFETATSITAGDFWRLPDAHFVAAAPTLVANLAAEVTRLSDALERIKFLPMNLDRPGTADIADYEKHLLFLASDTAAAALDPSQSTPDVKGSDE